MTAQQWRGWTRGGFFALFVLAPPLDIFRFDLTLGHFILFGQPWTLDLAPFQAGEISGLQAASNLFWLGLLPLLVFVGGGAWLAWRYGRIYCGWLCPHFSVVEMINGLMRRTIGKPSLWDRQPLPVQRPDGKVIVPDARRWPVLLFVVVLLAFVWALSLLSYLLPPDMLYHNLWHGTLSQPQALFLSIATAVFALEFLLARHLFCRFGCAIGLFQSLLWMANRRALVVRFARDRVADCIGCQQACDHACPMRLKPRSSKRHMFTCTQCGQCLQACQQVQGEGATLLRWSQGQAAEVESQNKLAKPLQRLDKQESPWKSG